MMKNLALISLAFFAANAYAAGVPAVKHVGVVIFENADYADVLRAPYFAKFAQNGALATHFVAETHPSQGNYIALTAGALHGVTGDGNIDLDVRHVGDLLEDAGKTWKVYAENYPGHCFLGAKSGDYARKHNPFMSFTNVTGDATRCANIVDAVQLTRDIAAGTLPDFFLYIPNLKNDGHDTGVTYADRWFNGKFTALLQDRRFTDGTLIAATYDESSLTQPQNQIFTALVGDMVQPGSKFTARADHYSLLKTIELALGLGDLGENDAGATPLTGIWK